MTIDEVDRLVRATTKPYPGAFIIRGDKKIVVWKGIKSNIKIENNVYHEIKLLEGFFYAVNYEVSDI